MIIIGNAYKDNMKNGTFTVKAAMNTSTGV